MLRYLRNFLMLMRNLRCCISQNSKLLEPEHWRACKLAGILKPMRGKRRGHKTYEVNNISTIQPRLTYYPFLGRGKQKKLGVNPKKFLNIQIHTSGFKCIEDSSASQRTSECFVPSLLLSNSMSMLFNNKILILHSSLRPCLRN